MTAFGSTELPILPQTPSFESHAREDVRRALAAFGDMSLDAEMRHVVVQAFESLAGVADRKHDRWVVTYSGGKDSTTVAILASIFLVANPEYVVRLDVVYSDTLMEMPPLRETADAMMTYMKTAFERAGLDAHIRVVVPPVEDRFWVKLIGRGYPPPGPRFRWCTHRLKIQPANALLDRDGRFDNAILTGVRYGESVSRDQNLKLSCATGGECGQDYWYFKGPNGSDRSYYAPIVKWRTCKVWDFLIFIAPALGWPTDRLFALYGNQDLRFGCWTCSLVRRDRTMEDIMKRPGFEHLAELHAFRNEVIMKCREPANRVQRPDGRLGAAVRVKVRQELLGRLLSLQERLGMLLITPEEVVAIRREWRKHTWRNENVQQADGTAQGRRRRSN